jgi:hypothetical protein
MSEVIGFARRRRILSARFRFRGLKAGFPFGCDSLFSFETFLLLDMVEPSLFSV